jgi:zinc transporter 1/2/3
MMLFVAAVAAQTVTVTITAPPTASATPSITAVSDCHAHSTVKYAATLDILSRITLTLTGNSWCMVGTEEYPISGPTATEQFQPQYTDCHKHGAKT